MISLREAREQQNLTVDQLADASTVTAETITAIEGGSSRASVVVGLKLSRALGMATTDIIELAPQSTGVLGGGSDPLLGPRVGPR